MCQEGLAKDAPDQRARSAGRTRLKAPVARSSRCSAGASMRSAASGAARTNAACRSNSVRDGVLGFTLVNWRQGFSIYDLIQDGSFDLL